MQYFILSHSHPYTLLCLDKIFEDDGVVASGTTSVAYDSERKKLYLHGKFLHVGFLLKIVINAIDVVRNCCSVPYCMRYRP